MCYSVMLEASLKRLEKEYNARILDEAFYDFLEKSKKDAKKYKSIEENPRIYPKYWAPIIVTEASERVIKPMRYRLLPSWSETELPSKYNLYNARLDSLETRRTWKSIFGKNHGIIVFKHFYEWVKEPEGKKIVLKYFPDDGRLVSSPVLFDQWKSPDEKEAIESFAIITNHANPEVAKTGHDRSPIFLKSSFYDRWLEPQGETKPKLMEILSNGENVYYKSQKSN